MTTTTNKQSRIWAFIVGNCQEWENDTPARSPTGDRGLYESLCRHLPLSQVVFLQTNRECSTTNCQRQLELILAETDDTNADVLIFYYGGHGLEEWFKTTGGKGGGWRYETVAKTIMTQFRGKQVWFLLDCCFSGRLAHYLPPFRQDGGNGISYLFLASQRGDWEASDDWWSITECMVNALNYCLLFEKSKEGMMDSSQMLSTQELIAYMAQHHAVCKHDWFQASLHGDWNDVDMNMPFLFHNRSPNGCFESIACPEIESSRNGSLLPRMMSFLSLRRPQDSGDKDRPMLLKKPKDLPLIDSNRWKRLVGLTKGDTIYAQWYQGRPLVQDPSCQVPYLLPMYYKATVLHVPENLHRNKNGSELQVEFQYRDLRWNSSVSSLEMILPECYFYSHDYMEMIQAHLLMAKYHRYFDASIPSGTRVWAMWEENKKQKVYSGTIKGPFIMDEPCWDEVTERLMKRKRYRSIAGPFVWVVWDNDDGWDLVPKDHCLFQSNKPTDLQRKELLQSMRANVMSSSCDSPKSAILRSMESMGRRFCSAPFSKSEVTCYWDKSHRKATIETKCPPLRTLVQHLDFDVEGSYRCVRWEDNGELSIIPECLIEKQ